MDHCRFFPLDHAFGDSKSFNGKLEKRRPPKFPSGAQILAQVDDLKDMKFGKIVPMPKRDDNRKKRAFLL